MALRQLLQQHARRLCSDAVPSLGAVPSAAVCSRRSFADSSEGDEKITLECSPFRGHRVSLHGLVTENEHSVMHTIGTRTLMGLQYSRHSISTPLAKVSHLHMCRALQLDPPGREVETSKSELWQMLTTMTRMRRLELSADQLYKTKLARGFLHLADGQVQFMACATVSSNIFRECRKAEIHAVQAHPDQPFYGMQEAIPAGMEVQFCMPCKLTACCTVDTHRTVVNSHCTSPPSIHRRPVRRSRTP
jgi:hypothetical protein